MSGNTRDWVRDRPPIPRSVDVPRYPLDPIKDRWTIFRPVNQWGRALVFGGGLLIPVPVPFPVLVPPPIYGFSIPIGPGTPLLALILLYTFAVLAIRLVAVRDLAAPRPLRHVLGYIQVHRHVMADCFVIDARPLPAVSALHPTRAGTSIALVLLIPAALFVTVNAFLLWTAWLAAAFFALFTGRLPRWWRWLAPRALDLLTIILVFAFTGAWVWTAEYDE